MKIGILPQPYDPNSEKDQSFQNAAARWELLRRNIEFKELARRWIADHKFRVAHSESNAYFHPQVHFPRCALDWMISGPARVELARVQLATGRWFMDNRFNFGPIIASKTLHPLNASWETVHEACAVQPLPDAPSPLRVEQAWPDTPEVFKRQFYVAFHDGGKFQVVTNYLHKTAANLNWAAVRLHRRDAPEKLPEIVQGLFELSQFLHELSEFHKIFAVPSADCPPGKFKEYLDAIRKHCAESGQIVRRYSAHKSWLGTTAQWRYYLLAEQNGYDTKSAVQMAALARIYSEDLKRGLYAGTVRSDSKRHGFIGTKLPSKAIANRRSTVRDFITDLQKWIANIYPPSRWLAFTRLETARPPKKISSAS